MVPKPPKTAYRDPFSLELLAILLVFGCSSTPDLPSMAGGSLIRPSDLTDAGTSLSTCIEGKTQACSKTLTRQAGVLSCYYGTQTCVGGQWSDCVDGTVVQQSASNTAGNGEQLASISTSQPCRDNPCDPTCQRYVEVPGTGLTAQAGTATWQTGNIGDFPANIQAIVSKPNCERATDCQQNQHCTNVSTNSACAHSKCQAGDFLTASCDPCVASVCNQEPSCCTWQPTCANGQVLSHDGMRCFDYNITKLARDDARVACKALGGTWDLACVTTSDDNNLLDAVTTEDAWLGIERIRYNDATSAFHCLNGEPVLANGLTQGQWPWRAGEPNYYYGNAENCAEIYAADGMWNDINCTWQLASWCEGPSTPSGWTNECAGLVAGVCGATCGNDTPACETWGTGETNPNDSGPDLSIGVPCQGQIPVCNHGTVLAPAGAVVHVLPTTNPFGTPNDTADLGTCATTTTIASGACVMVGGCQSLLTQNTELWVGYPAGTTTESRTDDNWGYNVPGVVCGSPRCISGAGPCFASVTKTFDYSGVCPQTDQIPQWSFLTFESSTPGDSSIAFSVAAASADQISNEPSVPLANVTHASGNEQCELSGPTSSHCPVDLFKALTPSATTHGGVLRLTVTLNPSSDGVQSPILSGWRISYSCVAGT